MEERKDIGIFFNFEWSPKLQKIIIKRDKDNYPIIRFSLFDKMNLKKGTVVKKISSVNLSNQSDEQIKKISKVGGIWDSESNRLKIDNPGKYAHPLEMYLDRLSTTLKGFIVDSNIRIDAEEIERIDTDTDD